MLGARASRLTHASSSQPAAPAPDQYQGPRVSETTRNALWRSLVLKLLWVLNSFEVKKRTLAVLGREVYQRVFNLAQESAAASSSGAQTPSRVINGECVGSSMAQGSGPQIAAPPSKDRETL